MAQDIITLTLCDVCLSTDDERHDAAAYQIPSPAGLADIDLCDVHAKPYQDVIVGLLPFARVTKPRATRGGNIICPLCGKGLKDQPGLTRHFTRTHPDASPADMAAAGRPVPTADGSFVCPECDRTFTAPQGLAVHRHRAHGVRGAGAGTESA